MFNKLLYYKGVLSQDMEAIANAHWEQFRLLVDTLEPICGELKGKVILDVGCGRLYPYTLLLSNLGNKVIGIDTAYIGKGYAKVFFKNGMPSFTRDVLYAVLKKDDKYYEALKKFTPLNFNNIRITQGDAQSLDFRNDVFDIVVSNAVFEHIKNVPKAVSELTRVLKQGGIAYIGINLFTSLAGGHHNSYLNPSKVIPWGHLRYNDCAPVYLNKLREAEFTRMFQEKLNILKVMDVGVGEGKEFLTPEVREELSGYYEEELLKRDIIIVAKKNA